LHEKVSDYNVSLYPPDYFLQYTATPSNSQSPVFNDVIIMITLFYMVS